MPTQLRDSRGRFVKVDWDEIAEIPASQWGTRGLDDEEVLKIAPSIRLAIWWSEHWTSVVGYISYAVLCFILGMVGGIMGVRVSL